MFEEMMLYNEGETDQNISNVMLDIEYESNLTTKLANSSEVIFLDKIIYNYKWLYEYKFNKNLKKYIL